MQTPDLGCGCIAKHRFASHTRITKHHKKTNDSVNRTTTEGIKMNTPTFSTPTSAQATSSQDWDHVSSEAKTLLDHPDFAKRESIITLALVSAAVIMGTQSRGAYAFTLADLSQGDASAGVKAALEKGANVAVQLLGKQDGFWANDKVRIPLPEWINKAERAIKLIGRGKDVDDLKLGVNRAAEQAVPMSKELLQKAVKSMSVTDAKSILTGGDNSVTKFFKDKTQSPLTEKFLPVVTGVTSKIGLATQYNKLADQVGQTGFVKLSPEQARVERHVTVKALDGLYYMIGEEEKKIRQNPVGAGSDILRRVFGVLKG
jgi:Protein of unknown function (DUF4197)